MSDPQEPTEPTPTVTEPVTEPQVGSRYEGLFGSLPEDGPTEPPVLTGGREGPEPTENLGLTETSPPPFDGN